MAAGAPISGKNYTPKLFALECRINAEDPANNFLPQIGKITGFHTPEDVRVDTGIITAGSLTIQGHMPSGMRDAFVTDKWNPTAMLLADFGQVQSVASNLPYVSGF